MKLSRKEFLRNSTFGIGFVLSPAIISTCVRSDENDLDIRLSSNIDSLSEIVKKQYNKISNIAEKPDKEIRIGLDDKEVVIMSLSDSGAASYRHLKLRKESTGETANILFGRDGFRPSVRLADDNGETITKNGQELEFAFELPDKEKINQEDWFMIGITVTAIALAIWIGASIAKAVFAALAFLAFSAMVLGLIAVGLSVLPKTLEWIFETTGWGRDYIISLFKQAVEKIRQSLNEIVYYLNL